MVEATRPTLHFGNGVEGKAEKIRTPKLESDGQMWTQLLIQPTDELIEYYSHLKIKEKLIDGRFIYRKYPTKWIERVNDDPLINVIRIKCGFDWEPTSLTEESYKDDIIAIQQRTIRELKRFLANQAALMEKLVKRPTEYIKHIVEMAKQIKQLEGRKTNEMEDYQEGDSETTLLGGQKDA